MKLMKKIKLFKFIRPVKKQKVKAQKTTAQRVLLLSGVAAVLFCGGGVAAWNLKDSLEEGTKLAYIAPLAGDEAANIIAPQENTEERVTEVDYSNLRSYKALYEVSLSSLKTGAQISNLTGEMFFEWKKDCDAWISDHRSNLFYEYAEGGGVNVTTDFATYESLDGKSISFNTRREQDGKIFEEFRGYANLSDPSEDAHGAENVAHYTIPDGLTHDLPAETILPMHHTVEILKKAEAGEKFYNAIIFDGSDDAGPHAVNVFVGKELSKEQKTVEGEDIDQSLLDSKAWNLRMAFFPLESDEESAEYEMTLNAHKNGVVSYVAIEYEKFAIEQKLVAIEAVDEPQCGK